MKSVKLTLPSWAFLDAHDGSIDHLSGRTVILHIRSSSVIEIFNENDVALNEDILSCRFYYINKLGVRENMVAALHYCTTLDKDLDRKLIKNEILKPCAIWYCDYCTREDDNIIEYGHE